VTITTSESPATASEVILGIDTHLDVHVAVALDGLGRCLGELNVPTTVKGYQRYLLRGLLSFRGLQEVSLLNRDAEHTHFRS
jgi:hypothetical protein